MYLSPRIALCDKHKKELVEAIGYEPLNEGEGKPTCDGYDRFQLDGECTPCAASAVWWSFRLVQLFTPKDKAPADEVGRKRGTRSGAKTGMTKTAGKRSARSKQEKSVAASRAIDISNAERQLIQAWFRRGWLVEDRADLWHRDVVNINKASSDPVTHIDFDSFAVKLEAIPAVDRIEIAQSVDD